MRGAKLASSNRVVEKGAANGHGRPSAGGEAGAGRREQEGAGADAGTATGEARHRHRHRQAQAGEKWGLGRVMGYGLRAIWEITRCGIREAGTCFDLGQARVRRRAASSHGTRHGMRRGASE
jgi:hypothetical protein